MAIRIELWEDGKIVGGHEEWWDGIEALLEGAGDTYPILDSINPYGESTVASDRLSNLADECRQLALTAPSNEQRTLVHIARLCPRATAATGAKLRFDGD